MDLPFVQSATKRRGIAITLFVMVAIFCGWIGWNANFVRERKAWQSRVGPARAQLAIADSDSPNIAKWRTLNNASKPAAQTPITTQEIPLVRQILGDEPFDFLTAPASEEVRIRSLFPEAFILSVPDDQWKY